MKKYFPVALLVFLSFSSFGQSNKAIEKDLNAYIKKLNNFDNGADSISYIDSLLEYKILYYAGNFPATLTYNFKGPKDMIYELDIITSSDGLFRIYNWDDRLGGTARTYMSIFQYKGGTVVKSYEHIYKEDDNEDLAMEQYNGIDVFKANNKVYYLTSYYVRGSSRDREEGIRAFCIESGKLNDTIQLFKTDKGVDNKISYSYDLFATDSTVDLSKHTIYFNKQSQRIFLPVVVKDTDGLLDKVSKDYIQYYFTGRYFEAGKN